MKHKNICDTHTYRLGRTIKTYEVVKAHVRMAQHYMSDGKFFINIWPQNFIISLQLHISERFWRWNIKRQIDNNVIFNHDHLEYFPTCFNVTPHFH